MVWFGFFLVWLVWLVWFDLVRFGLVWCGLVWFGLVGIGLVNKVFVYLGFSVCMRVCYSFSMHRAKKALQPILHPFGLTG